jgi:hypothetical protein
VYKQVIAGPFERIVRTGIEDKDNISSWDTGLIFLRLDRLNKSKVLEHHLLITGTREDNSLPIGHSLLDKNLLTSLLLDRLCTLTFLTSGTVNSHLEAEWKIIPIFLSEFFSISITTGTGHLGRAEP